MRITVCLKRAPDTTTKILVWPDGRSIDENGVRFVPNPNDECALEETLKLKEAAAAGETVVDCLGGDAAQATTRTPLAIGIDRALLLQATPPADGPELSRVLAAELKGAGHDLILFGKPAVDDHNHRAGVMVEALLALCDCGRAFSQSQTGRVRLCAKSRAA